MNTFKGSLGKSDLNIHADFKTINRQKDDNLIQDFVVQIQFTATCGESDEKRELNLPD